MNCPYCRSEVSNDIDFCSNCGTNLKEVRQRLEQQSKQEDYINEPLISNSNNKPNKSNKKSLIVLLLVLLFIVGGVCLYFGFIKKDDKESVKEPEKVETEDKNDNDNEDIDKPEQVEKEEFSFNNIQSMLKKEFENGNLTADQYVKNILYAQYDKKLLDSKYSNLKASEISFHTDEIVEKYLNELSDETLKYYYKKANLQDITFELDEEDNNLSFMDLLVDKVYAESSSIANLNKVVLSKNKNFVVWYTTTGDSKTDYNTAKKIADGLEYTVEKYKELFNVDFKFSGNLLSNGKQYKDQVKVLENAGLDANLLKTAMQIYVVDYGGDNPAKHVDGYTVLSEAWNRIQGNDDYGSITFPYILIKPSSTTEFERLEQLYNHELFHYYQYHLLCKQDNGCQVGSDPYMGESTANMASALATRKTNNYGFLNEWAGTARKYSSNLMSDEWANEKGIDNVGYALFVYMTNYLETVENGASKIAEAIYQDDALKYLQDSATKEELIKIQSTIAYKNLTQDYNNKNLIVDVKLDTPIQIKKTVMSETKISNEKMSRLAIDYYLLDVSSSEQQYEIKLIRDNSNVNVSIIGEFSGRYRLLESSSIENENFIFNTNYYGDYDKIYIVVLNLLPALTNYYSIDITKTSLMDKESMLENYELDESLIINGFKFNLGLKLEDFIKGTGAIIDEKDLEDAKSKSNTLYGISYEVATKIISDGREINFDIYVNTTDLDNIKVNGISIKSDRGFFDISPDFLAFPNLVTCEFKILGKYNIDTSTFDDLDKILKVQATRSDNEYSNGYNLQLRGKTGFGIKISFNTFEKKRNKYYISHVSITNNTGWSW